jgi:N-acetylglucosaminyl-diphospho-decaprenol L-rhamnosyltransferase
VSVDISIVVVNYRSADLTVRALEAAARSAAPYAVEEIVVDSASGGDEESRLRAGRPGAVLLIRPENRGFAAGNNAGIAVAQGRYLLLLNPDAFPKDRAVAQLAAHLDRHPDVGLAAPRLVFSDGRRQDSAYKRFPNHLTLLVDYCAPLAHLLARTPWDPHRVWHRRLLNGPRSVAHATGAALLVRVEAVADAGPLDEGFFLYYEETEWQRRIAEAGWRRDVVPAATVVHLGGGSSGGFPLASPHYLASVRRYFGASRSTGAIMWIGSALSALTLGAAVRLGVRNPAIVAQAHGYRRVLQRLRAERRHRASAA